MITDKSEKPNEVSRRNLDAAWRSFEEGLDGMVREEEAALRRVMNATWSGTAAVSIQEEIEAAQARAAEILVSARALADAEREHAALELKLQEA